MGINSMHPYINIYIYIYIYIYILRHTPATIGCNYLISSVVSSKIMINQYKKVHSFGIQPAIGQTLFRV